MDLTTLDDRTRIALIVIAIALYLIGIILGYRKGKKSRHLRTVGTILVNPDADVKNHEPAFKMQITPEFVNVAYSKTLSNKIKYAIFEIREEADYENNGLL